MGVGLSRDGSYLASASLDRSLKIWDPESGELLATFTCEAAAWCCAFLNDREVTAGDVDGKCRHKKMSDHPSKIEISGKIVTLH